MFGRWVGRMRWRDGASTTSPEVMAVEKSHRVSTIERLAHMTKMFACLMLSGDVELRASYRRGLRTRLCVWLLRARCWLLQHRTEETIQVLKSKHLMAMEQLTQEAARSLEAKDAERDEQVTRLSSCYKRQSHELLLVFGIQTLSNMLENASFASVTAMFASWKGYVTMVRYTIRLNEVLALERGALLAAGAHAQDELNDARKENTQLSQRLMPVSYTHLTLPTKRIV
eukprot:TRINITY_DN17782_c0_g2_i1.p1 TRINITY_DN17782_c0_g2~~TRINITY_DN17782_c0_g2_i1.p1  ORF type:complete len:228 (-),score=52.59 TRINITY_DN17782_c0_g2_i1:82-765(-)